MPNSTEPAGPATDAVDAYLDEAGSELLARFNVDFEDSVLLIGRALTPWRDATSVTLTAVDRAGFDVVVADAAGEHVGRLDFDEAVSDPAKFTAAIYGLLLRAREVTGGEGEATSAERTMAAAAAIRTFLTTVVSVEQVLPHLRSITFGGGDLVEFEPLGPDSFVYVLAAPPGCDHLAADRDFSWETYPSIPDDIRPIGAYYTVRRWDPVAKQLEAHFVLHGDEGQASAWAARVQPGEPVALWGPRTAYEPPPGIDHLVLIADDTGLPAVASILEQLPVGVTAQVVAEVDDATDQQELLTGPGITITWLHRDGAEPGTTTLLPDAVRALPVPSASTYVWGGGESRTMTAIRTYLRKDLGFPREAISLVAYWRHRNTPL